MLLSLEQKQENLEFAIKQAIAASGMLGANWVAMHPRSAVTNGYSTKKALEGNKEVFCEYLDIAKKYNTGIAIENLPTFDGIVPIAPFYSSNPDDLMDLVDSFKDDKVGICWDTGHANLMSMNQAEKIQMLGHRIKCTHIHNNFGSRDHHLPPDQGNIPWQEVMQAFKDIEYKGALTLETHCCYTDKLLLESFAKHNFECLQYL